MSDYIVSRSLVLIPAAQPRPSGPAITALHEANVRLQQSRPQQQTVPAYQPGKFASLPAQNAVRSVSAGEGSTRW